MLAQRIAVAVLTLLGLLATDLSAEENNEPEESKTPAVRIIYLGIHDTTIKQTGEAVKVAVLRMENPTSQSVSLTVSGRKPNMLIQKKTDEDWKTVYWNWCGTGTRKATLEPAAEKTWCIDPAFYAGKYGPNLRFGVWIEVLNPDAEKDSKTTLSIVWTDLIEFPKVDNPPELEFAGALYRAATKDEVPDPVLSVPSHRQRRFRRR